MWQRVQTLYLAISTILIGVMLLSAKAVTYGAEGSVADTIRYTSYIPYLILLIIIFLLNLLALTTYKHRVFQMRTAGLSAIITLALQAWLVLDFVLTHNDVVFRLSAIFPIVTVALDLLAYRGILSDEMIVASAYHLRKARRERRK